MIRKTIAFTLAETLIVMGIIGVVSALTLPNLNSSTGEKEKVAKVKKIYQNLDDALGRAQAVYGPYDEWFQNDKTIQQKMIRFGERITEFMKISRKNTVYPKTDYCSYGRDGNSLSFTNFNSEGGYYYTLADGMEIMTYNDNMIFVDIDGYRKGRSVDGEDIFWFQVVNNRLIPFREDNYYDFDCFGQNGGDGCAVWVIRNDNMDYLKADSNGKCPNGKILNMTTNISCK